MPSFKMLSPDIAIDLGSSNIRIYVKGRGIVVNEPSAIVVRGERKKETVAVGDGTDEFLGRLGSEFHLIRPVVNGVINDYRSAEVLVSYLVNKAIGQSRMFRPRMVVGIPSGATSVDIRSIRNTMESCGAKYIYGVKQTIAAAVGMGLSIHEPAGTFVVDIGAGLTEMALISIGGIVCENTISIAGNQIDAAITGYLKKAHGLAVSERTAEQIKFDLTDIRPEKNNSRIIVLRGRDSATNMPITMDVRTEEICEAIEAPVNEIIRAIKDALSKTPPELCRDVLTKGIYLAGGSNGLPGLDELITSQLGIKTNVAWEAGECSIIGAATLADGIDKPENQSVMTLMKE
ncbi:MAG: rod shape-determining protein [Clostridia bacterium]|nr:rod shape-determining protein [Clostridia bacterium]